MAVITMREAISQALWEEMERDERVFILGEEVGVWGGTYAVTKGFYDRFGPERVRDTPIAEGVIVGAANGAAMAGLKPVAELMTINFAFLAMDQIVNHSAKLRSMFGGQFNVPIVIRAVSGGGRQLGATHSQTPDVVFAHFPGLKVVAPGTPADAKGLLKTCIRGLDPVLFFEHKRLYKMTGEVPEDEVLIPLGQADVKREGSDVTVIATGWMVHEALEAADRLGEDGVSMEVVDPRCLAPFDKATVFASVRKTHRVVIVEEAAKTGAFGAQIAAWLAEELFDQLDAPIQRVAAKDVPMPFSPPMEEFVIPNAGDVVAAVRRLLGRADA